MDVIEYLMDGDPAIRWQVMQDLSGAPADEVAAERAKVATEGWGAKLLSLQAEDGQWDGAAYRPAWADEYATFFDVWSTTHFSLDSLVDLGLDPDSPEARSAVDRVAENVRWDYNQELYFEGEVEPCINGRALAIATYFGREAPRIAQTLLETQLDDGGWNCWVEDGNGVGSFHSTICALEGLRDWELATGGTPESKEARLRGEEYLLERRLLFRASTGEVIDPRFAMLSFPTRWYYDVLRGADYFRVARPDRDPRCTDAVDLIRSKALPFGMWKIENEHQGASQLRFDQEAEGFPSRWVTLRALRVLRWWDAA
ncbi:hypothetical protein G5T42_01115 [Microbacterium sp. 4R-513]|uniref:hypothetical protein n=1 Tax=Microbacterium sp. 4R-513 TaxID=2567934 RepID=UPI0013E1AAED|nr:hypothetical protein [Microbacterium sp. 4R-513]QIG38249.1 hypothetical protein G5T42_01115 [Microbacterium sp. 4R-513]